MIVRVWPAFALLFAWSAAGQEPDMRVAEYMMTLEPTEHHQSLGRMAGDWNMVQRVWSDPAKPPTVSEGSASGTMRFGGRFLFLQVNGVSINGPVQVLIIFGYDVYAGKYNAVAVGENSTAMYTSTGDSAIDIFDMRGRMNDPLGDRPVRYLYRVLDDNSFAAEIFNTVDGQEVKVAEMEFHRRG